MDLIALAVPFFLFLLLLELGVDYLRGSGHYRSNDAINSLSAGVLSTTTGYFTKVLQWIIWGFVLSHLAVFEIQRSWFDASPTGIALWVLAALAWDFCYYWNHRLGHEVSILWASHAVHHQSEDYNLSTALRQTSTSFLFSWIFYVPLFVVGFPLDIVVTVGAANLIYQFWVHTQHIDRLGVLDRIFVTPSNHRVHHAQNEAYIDKNYGGILVLWDRLFGSFAEESYNDPVIFGVRKPLESWNPVWANFQVYDYLAFDARKTKRLRDKIGVWFRRTGWRPADVESRYPKSRADLANFEKYDPPLSSTTRRYVMGQFLMAIALTLYVADVFAAHGAAAVIVPCLLLWSQLFTIGLFNDSRPYAILFEIVRLFVVVPLGAVALANSFVSFTPVVWLVFAVYILGSTLWLRRK